MRLFIWIFIIVNAVMFIKIFKSAWMAGFKASLVFNELFWSRVGFLIFFHVALAFVAAFFWYIGAIINATL